MRCDKAMLCRRWQGGAGNSPVCLRRRERRAAGMHEAGDASPAAVHGPFLGCADGRTQDGKGSHVVQGPPHCWQRSEDQQGGFAAAAGQVRSTAHPSQPNALMVHPAYDNRRHSDMKFTCNYRRSHGMLRMLHIVGMPAVGIAFAMDLAAQHADR